MKHKLWIQTKLIAKSECCGLVFAVFTKLLAQSNKHTVQPSQDIRARLVVRSVSGNARHANYCCFLIKTIRNICGIATDPRTLR